MVVHETVGAPDAQRVGWFLHGILGRGRNWRTIARRLVTETPEFRFLLVDLPGHGESPPAPPHDLASCAAALLPLPPPELVIGHSFGGKVALTYLRDHAPAGVVGVVLDAVPGAALAERSPVSTDPVAILSVLRTLPPFTDSRDALRIPLLAEGIAPPIVDWLLTSALQTPSGWRFVWDLDVIEAMLRDYARADFWPWLSAPDHPVHLVRAGRSDRWTQADRERLAALAPPVQVHVLPDAGHWVHVDDPAGTLAILQPLLR